MNTVDIFLSEYQAEWYSPFNCQWNPIGERTGKLCEALANLNVAREHGFNTRISTLSYAPLERWMMPV